MIVHETTYSTANELAANVLVNTDAESGLLGSVIVDGNLYPLIELEMDEFYIHRHQWIWEAMGNVNTKGIFIDHLTVQQELDRMGKLHEIGGVAYLTDLISRSAFSSQAMSYAAIVKENAGRRKQLEIANLLAVGAQNGGADIAKIIDSLSETGGTERQGRMMAAGLVDLYESVKERSNDPKDTWGIPTGFTDLDKRTGGLHRQQTLMISGDPGVGKTTLMLQIALNAAIAGYGVAVFEAEMDEQRTLRRLVEIQYGIPNRAMVTGRMDNHWESLTEGIETLSKVPLFLNDDPGITTAKMRGELARLRARHKIDLVCLDYINLLNDVAGDGRSTNDDIALKAKRFRNICREMNLAGLTVQSMTKEGMKSLVPHLADMSGPAEVHYGADTVFFLTSEPDHNNVYNLLPAKQRDGDGGNGAIKLVRVGLPFKDIAKNGGMYPK